MTVKVQQTDFDLLHLQESEKLECVNADLKSQIEELKRQKQQLVYMLNLHRPTCIVRAQNGQTPEDERNLFIQHIKESTLQLHNLTSSTSTTTSSLSLSTPTVAPLDGGFLSLDHIHCPSHLWANEGTLSLASTCCCWCSTECKTQVELLHKLVTCEKQWQNLGLSVSKLLERVA